MGLRFMEHLLILTPDPDGTRDWWCNVLGMREGGHPVLASRCTGCTSAIRT
jgi:catechol 2,3-dioxygenase-like lactoylglutathione lyase family enzyme